MSPGDYAIVTVFLLVAAGAFVFSWRMALTVIRTGDQWASRLPWRSRFFVAAWGLVSGGAGLIVTFYVLVFCRSR